MLAVHQGVQFTCNLCNYRATDKGSLLRHSRGVHQGIRYYCDFCPYSYFIFSKNVQFLQRILIIFSSSSSSSTANSSATPTITSNRNGGQVFVQPFFSGINNHCSSFRVGWGQDTTWTLRRLVRWDTTYSSTTSNSSRRCWYTRSWLCSVMILGLKCFCPREPVF